MEIDKFNFSMQVSSPQDRDLTKIIDYILACLYSVKKPCQEKETFSKYIQTLASEDQEEVNDYIARILTELGMDHEKSLNSSSSSNISFDSTSGGASPYTSRAQKKVFEDKIEYLEDQNIKLNERIKTLLLELDEERKKQKKLDDTVRILKASNKRHETKLNQMEENVQSLTKSNEEYVDKNLQLEEELVKITQEKLSKIPEKIKTPIKEKTLEVQCESLRRQIEELKPYKEKAVELANELHEIKREKTILAREHDNYKIQMNENDRMYSTIQILQKKIKEGETEVVGLKKKMDTQKRKFMAELREASDASNLEMNIVATQFYSNGMQRFKNVLGEKNK